jgi:hypothetical protein
MEHLNAFDKAVLQVGDGVQFFKSQVEDNGSVMTSVFANL